MVGGGGGKGCTVWEIRKGKNEFYCHYVAPSFPEVRRLRGASEVRDQFETHSLGGAWDLEVMAGGARRPLVVLLYEFPSDSPSALEQ